MRSGPGQECAIQLMLEKQSFSVLVPPSHRILAQDLTNTIRSKCPRSRASVKNSTGDYCCIEVASGRSRMETWWAVKRIVSEVELRHKSGRVVEMMGYAG